MFALKVELNSYFLNIFEAPILAVKLNQCAMICTLIIDEQFP